MRRKTLCWKKNLSSETNHVYNFILYFIYKKEELNFTGSAKYVHNGEYLCWSNIIKYLN